MSEQDKQVLRITVEGLGNNGKTAVALLIVEMLEKLGVNAERMTQAFDVPAPVVLGMDNDRARDIVREVSDRVRVEVATVTRPK